MKKNIIYLLSISFITVLLAVFSKQIIQIDYIIANFISRFSEENIYINVMLIFSSLSSTVVLCLITFCCLYYMKDKNKYCILINLIFILLLNLFLKEIVARPRPENYLFLETGYSFPSGHAMVSTAFYGLLILYIKNSAINYKYKNILNITFLLIIFLVSISRVGLNVHYLSDVLAGIIISSLYLCIIYLFKSQIFKK